ncbi:MAG: DNA primase [Thermoplasmatales archaeon]|nr:MAG: DNA primase [Thermoplasmatales archaeon]
MVIDPTTTKYMIKATIKADGVIEKSDVVGAIFGQTEGLLGDELDLRELQRSARVGRIEVELESKSGKSEGTITLPTSLDKVETVILAAAFESIDRVGPCKANIAIEEVEDVRVSRRKHVIDRAKELIGEVMEKGKIEGESISDNVRQAVQVEEITNYGTDHCPSGPNIEKSDAIIVVEGRRDVLNLLKYGIKNVIAVGGTNIPKTVTDLSKEKITTVFVDGDRGGDLILRELLQVADVDFVARAPQTREVEEIPQKLVMKSLKNKIPKEQYMDMYNIRLTKKGEGEKSEEAKREFFSKRKEKKEKLENSVTSKQEKYETLLREISGSLKAVLLDGQGKELKKIPVRELTDEIKKDKKVSAVVFDGIVTQRLLDIAKDKDVKAVVGVKVGNVVKMPKSVKVFTKSDFQ